MSEVVPLHLPKIDPETLPELVRPTGMFGSRRDSARRHASDATDTSLEAYLYELHRCI